VEMVDPRELVTAAAAAARRSTALGGTVAVIAPVELHEALADALADRGAIADSIEAIDAPVAVLTGLDSKGLEFDHVVVVEPARLVAPDRSGLRLLYVVLTRATRRAGRRPRRAAARGAGSRTSYGGDMTTTTPAPDADLTAADVAWDLEPLVDGRGAEGVDALLDDAEARAHGLASYRGRIADLDVDGLVALMTELATIGELAGRAGNYAGLKFAVDTADPRPAP